MRDRRQGRGIRQGRRMGFDPIRHRLVGDAQRAPNPSQIHAIDIPREGLAMHRLSIPVWLRLWRILALTRFAQVPLAS